MIKKYLTIGRYRDASEKKLAGTIYNLFGFYPGQIHLYRQAFTHSSATTHQKSNERLEFLGDSIISAVVAEYLYHILPTKNEGVLTQVRSRMVSRSQQNKLAVKLGIDKILQTEIRGSVSSTLFGDAFEALIGAMYLDIGFAKTKKILLERVIKQHLEVNRLINEDTDYKSRLINHCQKHKIQLRFVVLNELHDGPKKLYHVGAELNGKIEAEAQNASKRVAEQITAQAVVEKLER